MKMPWTKRAEKERELRENAELRAEEIEKDWAQIRRHRRSIDREVELNDWTGTAIALFSGKEAT